MVSPIKRFSVGTVNASIWENEIKTTNGNTQSFETISLQKRYKDKNDEWKSSTSFKKTDLPKAVLALQKAFEYLSLKE